MTVASNAAADAASTAPHPFDHHAAMQQRFGWQVPPRLNMAQACCVRWAQIPDHANSIAVIADGASGMATFHSYAELHAQANRLANVLTAAGVGRGDRVAIVMPQRFETAVAYMGVLQTGAVGMPLSMLFGPDALAYRLQDSQAVVAICDRAGWPHLAEVRTQCPQLRTVLLVGDEHAEGEDECSVQAWGQTLAAASDRFACVDTAADEPAVLIYTSGTTGNPKGALIPHRALVGNLSGFVCSQNLFGFAPGPQGELPF
ncbi:MAG TPA: AMP-binding protein, partial [Burkholderiaceae bacterium]|nr:AMP-binding protein [Burkholderiaceae bacterium]